MTSPWGTDGDVGARGGGELHGDAFGPTAGSRVSDDARPDCGAAAVGGCANDAAGDVLSRAPSRPRCLEQERLAAVDRERFDRDHGLGRCRVRLVHLGEANHVC